MASLRRVTVNVPGELAEQEKDFFEKGFGMNVFYENVFESEDVSNLIGLKGKIKNKITVLQQGEETVGMVGLNEFVEPAVSIKVFEKQEGLPYPLIFVFMVQNIEEFHKLPPLKLTT